MTEKDILRFLNEISDRPLNAREIISMISVPAEERSLIRKLLRKMSRDGLLIRLKKGRYGLPLKMKLITGRVEGHPDGFGFVIPDEEGNPDIFINPRKMREVMHGDRVMCRVESADRKKAEGSIVRILERGQKTLVGLFDQSPHLAYVIPAERRQAWDIPIPRTCTMGARRGEAVLIELTRYPTKTLPPEGKIIEILGKADDPEIEIEMIIRKKELQHKFPMEVMEEAGKIASIIPGGEIKKRTDMRKRVVFTIDGERAKDFDDAVSLERKSNGAFVLGVHIADVSHYVRRDSSLDKEAARRGTSVYFPSRVIPMLPEALSNGICSLNPHEDRLTLSCMMEFDREGRRLSYRIEDTVIKSSARLTYTEAADYLEPEKRNVRDEERKKWRDQHKKVGTKLSLMKELALLLNRNRMKNGSVDFDLPEPDIICDLRGRIENIAKADRNIAHRIIEEFMLAANVCVAEHLENHGRGTIFRVHEPPSPEDLRSLRESARSFGYALPAPGKFTAKDLQGLLAKAAGRPEERLINHITLRSMKQAVYSTKNIGHFCLAFPCYTHFTSPIRRYPDLVVHRLIRELKIPEKARNQEPERSMQSLKNTAKISSKLERRAEDAEREAIKLKMVQFMSDKIGEIFEGFISGVAAFGFFVELSEIFIEGLVHVSSMKNDYYSYDEKHHALMGERRKEVFRLGDPVKVRVVNVSMERLRVDFEMVENRMRRKDSKKKRSL